jgi:hypothetical protein
VFRTSDKRYLAILLGLVCLLWIPRCSGTIDLRYDGGVYYVLGTSLAQGKGYRLLNEPGEIQAIQYPPLLPAIVAAHQIVLGTDDPKVVGPWLRFTYFLMALSYAVATYVLARHYLESTPAFLVGLITNLYLYTLFLSDLLFAEIPFALATVLFVISSRSSRKRVRAVLTPVLAVLAFLLRTAGVALLAAWVVEGLIQKRWQQAAIRTVVLLVAFVGWQAYIGSVTSSEEYENPAYAYQRAPYQYYNVSYGENAMLVDPFAPELGSLSVGGMTARFFGNLARLPLTLSQGVITNEGYWIELLRSVQAKTGLSPPPPAIESRAAERALVAIPIVFFSGLLLAGVVVLAVQRERFVPLYLGAYLGLMCLTPWPQQFMRYLTPVTPFLALALIQLLVAFRAYSVRRWSVRLQKVALAIVVLVVGTVFLLQAFAARRAYKAFYAHPPMHWAREPIDGPRLFFYDKPWTTYEECLAWLSKHAKANAVIATTVPHWVYLHTGLKAVLPPMEIDPDLAQQLLDSVPITHAIVDQHRFLDTSKYVQGAVERHPKLWTLAHTASDGQTRIYRRRLPD